MEKPGKPLTTGFRLLCLSHQSNKWATFYCVVTRMASSGHPTWVKHGSWFIPVLITRLRCLIPGIVIKCLSYMFPEISYTRWREMLDVECNRELYNVQGACPSGNE